ncbi:MAG: hypothetical protein ACC661_08650, partial [Verrucomicrobiales bacterium]
MNPGTPTQRAALTVASLLLLPGLQMSARSSPDEDKAPEEKTAETAANRPATVAEARGRARLLHETIHGALQVMHRDFFDPEDRHRIPSASLEDVFDELAR